MTFMAFAREPELLRALHTLYADEYRIKGRSGQRCFKNTIPLEVKNLINTLKMMCDYCVNQLGFKALDFKFGSELKLF